MYFIFFFFNPLEKKLKSIVLREWNCLLTYSTFGECLLCAESGKPLGKYEILILMAQNLTEEQRGKKSVNLCLSLRWRKIKMCIYVGVGQGDTYLG